MNSNLISPEGFLAHLVVAELLLGSLFCFHLWQSERRAESSAKWFLLLAIAWTIVLAAQFFTSGRAVLSYSIIPPASSLTRIWNWNVSLWLRRAGEPAMIAWLGVLMLQARFCRAQLATTLAAIAAGSFVTAWMLEVLSLHPRFHPFIFAQSRELFFLRSHALLSQLSLLLSLISLFSFIHRSGEQDISLPLGRRLHTWLPAMVLLISFVLATPLSAPPSKTPLAGAHYYSWFPENWNAGYAGEKFAPPVVPALGKYESATPEVFGQHQAWFKKAGLGIFIFDWWPKNPAVRKRIDRQIRMLDEQSELKFAIQYESLDLREVGDEVVPNETENTVYMSPARAERLKAHLEKLAKRYLRDSNYLRFDGKAVVFVYATRHLVGPVAEAFRAAREQVFRKTGVRLFLVADEVYFHVLDYNRNGGVFLRPELSPDWDRISAFDALTCYNPYDSSRPRHGGSQGVEEYYRDSEALFLRYRAIAATAGIPFIPGVLPGYNDRGVRPAENHFVLPRFVGKQDFFEIGLKRLVAPFLARQALFYKEPELFPFFAITSWNEWNEGTQIEPSAPSAEGSKDADGGNFFSASESYSGYAENYLDVLPKFLESLEK